MFWESMSKRESIPKTLSQVCEMLWICILAKNLSVSEAYSYWNQERLNCILCLISLKPHYNRMKMWTIGSTFITWNLHSFVWVFFIHPILDWTWEWNTPIASVITEKVVIIIMTPLLMKSSKHLYYNNNKKVLNISKTQKRRDFNDEFRISLKSWIWILDKKLFIIEFFEVFENQMKSLFSNQKK